MVNKMKNYGKRELCKYFANCAWKDYSEISVAQTKDFMDKTYSECTYPACESCEKYQIKEKWQDTRDRIKTELSGLMGQIAMDLRGKVTKA